MDATRFDALARSLRSRRAVGGAVLGALTGLLGLGDVAAAPCPKGKQRCGKRCIPRRQCCTNADCRPKGSGQVCRRGRCGCPPRKKRCRNRCIPKAACCQQCPPGHVCTQARCCIDSSAALTAALVTGGPAVIRLCPNTTYPGSFTISRNVTLLGAGASSILDGGAVSTVVQIPAGVTAALRDLQVRNGNATAGGGVSNAGNLEMTGCLVTNNTGAFGAGIFNRDSGVLMLSGCLVTSNYALATNDSGGGIFNDGDLTLLTTGVTANRGHYGAGIFTYGPLSLRGASWVMGNVAFQEGGGLFVIGTAAQVTLLDTTLVTNNDANPTNTQSGGGIYNFPSDPGVVTFAGSARVMGNRPNDCTGVSCPS